MFILSICGYFGVIYLRISGLEAFSLFLYIKKSVCSLCLTRFCIMDLLPIEMRCVLWYYASLYAYMHYIWFMCYAFMYYACHYVVLILCDAVSRNHPIKTKFRCRHFPTQDFRLMTQDFWLKISSSDSWLMTQELPRLI